MSKLTICLRWMKTRKVLGVTVWDLGKLAAPEISPGIFSNRVVTGEQMEPAGSADSRCSYSLNALKNSLSNGNRIGFFID